MEILTTEERAFLENLLKYKPQRNTQGYYHFVYKRKKYKRSRVIMQLSLNKKLNVTEIVHHINGDKSDDRIENLKVVNAYGHQFEHHKFLPD